MKKIISIILIGIIFSASSIAGACQVFHASNQNLAFGGNNEASSDPNTYIYFIPSTDSEYGKVIVGYAGIGWIQGGMNEKGLFWDGLSCPYLEVVNSTGKPRFNGHIFDYILSVCDTCDEALNILDQYSMVMLESAQILYGDRYGDSFIIEGDIVHIKNNYYQIATNFYLSQYPDPPYPCWRYNTALAMFESNGVNNLSLDFCRSVLDAVHQEGTHPTQYSTIYDLKNQLIYVYCHHDFNQVKVFDLSEELMLGYHSYLIPALFTTPPDKPDTPIGPTALELGDPGIYNTSATDPDNNLVQYRFDWDASGSHSYSAWTSLGASGHTDGMSHSWSNAGSYVVKAQARDEPGIISDWSDGLIVFITETQENNPPYSPKNPNPSNHKTGVNINSDLSWTCSDPDEGDIVTYDIYFGDVNPPPLIVSDYPDTSYEPGTMELSITYYWYIVARDNHGLYRTGPLWDFTTEEPEPNQPPNKPDKPSGETNGIAGDPYSYTTSTTDPNDGDVVKYGWDLDGDGSVDKWDDNGGSYYSSGVQISTSLTWSSEGTYSLKVIAEDINGAQSEWSDPLSVTMPRNRAINTLFFNFLQNHPLLYQLLQRFL